MRLIIGQVYGDNYMIRRVNRIIY